MRFYFVRHGESIHNAMGLFCGSLDSPLTRKGEGEARTAALALDHVALDWVVSSPLVRARYTAEAITSHHGLRVELDPRLAEHTKGVVEGTPHHKMPSAAWPSIDGAESMTELYARVYAALVSISARTGTGVVVAHAGVARAIEAIHHGTAPEDLYGLKKAGNAAPYLVEMSYADLVRGDPQHAAGIRSAHVLTV